MRHLTAIKISVSLLFLNLTTNEMIFYRISILMLAILFQRYLSDKKSFPFDPVQERETKWNFTGCQVHILWLYEYPKSIY